MFTNNFMVFLTYSYRWNWWIVLSQWTVPTNHHCIPGPGRQQLPCSPPIWFFLPT